MLSTQIGKKEGPLKAQPVALSLGLIRFNTVIRKFCNVWQCIVFEEAAQGRYSLGLDVVLHR